ncbi:hypothetical protein AVEN_169567-1, partial [Araneus ventricosus]
LWAIINNAGISKGSEIEITSIQKIEEVIDVNLMGTIRVTKAFLPLLRRSKGRVINVASAAAVMDDGISALKTRAFSILLPFLTSYLCNTRFSAVAALNTKYRSQINIGKELRVSIYNFKPSFEKLCSAGQVQESH